ncbi:5-dehydro-4-deoxy-D-glucuronate isomerase [Enterovibrio sp. ZSDZ35]|uniref:4-deoxy-L-threo-5-hexosulose-uronate ketol-isomerase n=1 Tax=Enterovibrio qingdaonensis TaxID=2899818 RepID=A0ABT5QRL1_9GAMM|nr:5-dehydro-4-deoxy-D-glucuronate isomerase [Enterovibrio sp. ZSDZ35]MDD1783625.1 5-dehydro-4-deoxy-D-glucuronate isomerase [Enterovibrio sp. ZSDZ35]
MKCYYSTHPEDYQGYDTQKLRDNYLIESLFCYGEVRQFYCYDDRLIVAGVCPQGTSLSLVAGKALGGLTFFSRREAAAVNLGADGVIRVGDEVFSLAYREALYVGKGEHDVSFESVEPSNPAKFYVCSAPSHHPYPVRHIGRSDVKKIHLGDPDTANERIIHQYIHPDVCPSSQLALGLTDLINASNWNTMPCHTHSRRMEAYFYFFEQDDTRVFHFMGKPNETRHLVIANEQVVISPSWSIHSGVGTRRYSFIWAMAGENQEFGDMDFIKTEDMR